MNHKKKVVIIGGGFAGSLVAKRLENRFDVTLVDKKDYFEYTPGILRSIVEPSHLDKIHVGHDDYLKKTTFVKGEVKKILKSSVVLEKDKFNFDYLVIASGSLYHPPIKVHNLIDASNAGLLKKNYEKLCLSKKVLIIGGGIVGVELAAEIAKRYGGEIKRGLKSVSLIHSGKRLMPRESEKVSEYADSFLKDKGVNIVYNKKCDEKDTVNYDLVFLSTGVVPNSKFMHKKFLDKCGYILANDYLQLLGKENVFVAGDVASINEEKLAQNAENQAEVVIENIKNIEEGGELMRYESKECPKVISLGKYWGIFSYRGMVFCGFFPGMLKNFIEFFVVWRYRFL